MGYGRKKLENSSDRSIRLSGCARSGSEAHSLSFSLASVSRMVCSIMKNTIAWISGFGKEMRMQATIGWQLPAVTPMKSVPLGRHDVELSRRPSGRRHGMSGVWHEDVDSRNKPAKSTSRPAERDFSNPLIAKTRLRSTSTSDRRSLNPWATGGFGAFTAQFTPARLCCIVHRC
jgi:hypothetical protein